MTLPSLLAIAVYGTAMLSCAVAWRAAGTSTPGRHDQLAWLVVLIIVALLFLVRFLGIEDQLRLGLRELIQQVGRYESRRTWQALMAIFLLFVTVVASIWAYWHWRRASSSPGQRQVWTAFVALAGFALLYCLRFLSLHAIDALLYFGPIHPNWLLEAALLAVVALAALRYAGHRRRAAALPQSRRL